MKTYNKIVGLNNSLINREVKQTTEKRKNFSFKVQKHQVHKTGLATRKDKKIFKELFNEV